MEMVASGASRVRDNLPHESTSCKYSAAGAFLLANHTNSWGEEDYVVDD